MLQLIFVQFVFMHLVSLEMKYTRPRHILYLYFT